MKQADLSRCNRSIWENDSDIIDWIGERRKKRKKLNIGRADTAGSLKRTIVLQLLFFPDILW